MRSVLILILLACCSNTWGQSADSTQYVLGKFNPAKDARFKEIPTTMASRSGMFVRSEVLTAFEMMRKAAKADGIELKIISATRNFNSQKSIWEAKWNGIRKVDGQDLKTTIPDKKERALKILNYSSMPGTSRHHWGTDIDINSVSPSYFESGKGKKEYEWLRDNGFQYGFCQVYSTKGQDRPSGYEEEKWHWSYIPIASQLTTYFKRQIVSADMGGFDGSDALPFTEIKKYVLGIAPECK